MTPFETLVKYRAEYPPIMSPAQNGELMNRVAWDFRNQDMALLGKPSGSNVPIPSGELISTDYLVHVPSKTGHDVSTNNSSNNFIPLEFTWGPGPEDLSGHFASGSRTIVKPVNPGQIIPSIIPPVSSIPPVDNSDLQKQINDLKMIVESNRQRMEAINSRFESESKNLNVHRPLPRFVGKVFGIKVISYPE